MPYQALLDTLLRRVPGAQSALLLDAEGEVVVEAGARDFRHRLIGAYQGIALATVRRAAQRYLTGTIDYMQCRYAWGHVILRPLKDGYYLVLSLAPDGAAALGLHRSADAQARLNLEL